MSRDPAPALERRMNDFLIALKKKGVLPTNLYYKIRSSAGKTPRLYGLPKVHKPGIPLRPIVSFISSPTYQLSKHLANILSPLVGNASSHVINSFEFSAFITKQKLPKDTKLVSFDVVSLFTKVPIDRAIDVARDRLINDSSLEDHTMLSPAEVLKLLQFCLNATYVPDISK